MADVMKVGFIGCGGNARGHMRSVSTLENAKIVATCDLVEDLANSSAEEFGAKPYTDHEAMMDTEKPDAVYISIPVHTHGAPEMAAIERGIPFLVEKPVAREMETTEKVEEAVAKAGLITAVGYQLRYYGSVEAAKEVMKGRPINLVLARYISGTGRGGSDKWTRQFAKSGGQILEQATHTIDMMRYLVGDVKEVYCQASSVMLDDIDCPDTTMMTCVFENGAIGSLGCSWAHDPRDWAHANLIDIAFDQCLLLWGGGKAVLREANEARDLEAGPNQNIDAVFVTAVQNNDPSAIRSPYADAVKSLAISLAALESAETGKPVNL